MLPCSDLAFSGSCDQNEKKVKSRGNQVDLRQSLDIVGTLARISWCDCNSLGVLFPEEENIPS